jgi:hypothetical protein
VVAAAGRASPRGEAMLKASQAKTAAMAGKGSGSGTASRPPASRPPVPVSSAPSPADVIKPKPRASPTRASTRSADTAALSPAGSVGHGVAPLSSRGARAVARIVPLPMEPAVDQLHSSSPTPDESALHKARSHTFGSFGGLTLVKGSSSPGKAGLRSPTGSSRKIQLGGKAPGTAAAAFAALSAPPVPAAKPASSPPEPGAPVQPAGAAADGEAGRPAKKHASPKRNSPKRASPKRASPKRASPKRASPKHSPLRRSSPRRNAGVPARLSEHFKSIKPMAGGFKMTLGGGYR